MADFSWLISMRSEIRLFGFSPSSISPGDRFAGAGQGRVPRHAGALARQPLVARPPQAVRLFISLSQFPFSTFSVTRMRMDDPFANGRRLFGGIRVHSHFPDPSFAGGPIGWPRSI
jgi:hypothetical protein